MNQQIVVRKDVGEIRPQMRRRALSPIKQSDGEDGLETKDKERPVQSEARYGEKNDWAKDGPQSRSYQLIRSVMKTQKFYQSNSHTLKIKSIFVTSKISL